MAMPVDSHPLSPDEITSTSRNPRQRAHRNTESDLPRPVTSYFTLKTQSDERAAASAINWNAHDARLNPTDATVKPPTQRHPSNPFNSSFSISSAPPEQINGYSVKPSIVSDNSSKMEPKNPEISSPGLTPRAQFLALTADANETSLTKIATTRWHVMTDDAMDANIGQISESLQASDAQQQGYRAALRILSSQLDALRAEHASCERERNGEKIKRRKIAELMKTSDPKSVPTLRKVLDILSEDTLKESPLEGPQLVCFSTSSPVEISDPSQMVSESLTEAIAEAFTPLGVPSGTATNLPSETMLRSEDALSTDKDTMEKASIRSQASSKSRDSRTRPGSVIGDWMGGWWRDKNRSDTSIRSGASSREQSPSREGSETERDKGTTKVSKKRALTTFGIPSWMNSVPPSAASTSSSLDVKRESRRKLSITTSQSAASVVSPLVAHFQPLPTPILPPTIAPQILTPGETSTMSDAVSIPKIDNPPPLPSGPHPSHIRAISYATRVMTSDPNSILYDGGDNVSPLVSELAYNLVNSLKADKGFHLRDGRHGNKSTPQKTPTSSTVIDAPPPAIAFAQIEPAESRATIVSNLSRTLNNSVLANVGPRTSAAIAGPILATFKSRPPALSEPARIGHAPSAAQATLPSAAPNSTAPKTGTVELDSIIPADAKPPTLYLSRTYTSSVADPSFRPSVFPSAPSRFSAKASSTSRLLELQTDRFGFIYDVCAYDVNLLANARAAHNTAPACLTGVRISDRNVDSEDDDWWPSYEGDAPPSKKAELKVMPEPCSCDNGLWPPSHGDVEREGKGITEGQDTPESADTSNATEEGTGGALESDTTIDSVKSSSKEQIKSNKPVVSNQNVETIIPNHVCFNTVRFLLSQLTSMHDTKQKAQQVEWESFLRRIRRIKESSSKQAGAQAVLAQASSGAAAFLGLSKANDEVEDEETNWTAGLGLSQLSSNKDEWKDFSRLIRAGIPLLYRAKIWLECSGALELVEPGTFRDLALEAKSIAQKMQKGEEKNVPLEEIEKDVTRTMPLNVFFGGDGQGVEKLRGVLGAYSLLVSSPRD